MKKDNLPTGAEALLIAINTPGFNGQIGIPVLLWGKPGVGKSSFIEGLRNQKIDILTLIASIHDPTDFSGLPIHHEGKVKYAIPEWVSTFSSERDGILFLDELSTAPPSVQASLLRVVLERKVGFHELPDSVRIVAAANPPDLMVGGWELSPPLRNRFIHLNWDIPTEVYIQAMSDGWNSGVLPNISTDLHKKLLLEWKLKIAAFLKISPNMLHSMPDDNPFGFASPRTWEFTAALLASCEILGQAPVGSVSGSSACFQLIKGCLGEGTAIPFMEFLKNLKLPNPQDVLDQKVKLDISSLNDSEIYVIFGSLNRVLKNRFDSPELLSSALVYFDLVQRVFADGKRDLIYVSLKQISKDGMLMKVLSAAQRAGGNNPQRVMKAIKELFSDEGLKEFIDVFET